LRLRGTAATRFYVAGLPERAIAEIMAWSEEQVIRIIRRYVDSPPPPRRSFGSSTKRECNLQNWQQNSL
jgi:transposase